MQRFLTRKADRFAKREFGVELNAIRDMDHFRELYRPWRRRDVRRRLIGILIGVLIGAVFFIILAVVRYHQDPSFFDTP